MCNNVTVGANAVILGPIEIGSHSIVGANATVTKSVPDHSVVAGFRAEVVATCEDNIDYHFTKINHFEEKIFLSRRELYEKISDMEARLERLEKKLLTIN